MFDTAIGNEYCCADDVDTDRLDDVTIIHGGESVQATSSETEDDNVGKLKVINDKRKASLQLGSAKKGVKMRLLQGG